MDTPKFLFLFLLSTLASCSTGVLEKHQTFHLSRKQQIINTVLPFLNSNSPVTTAADQGNSPATVTVQPTPPLVTGTPPTPTTVSPPTTTNPVVNPPAAVPPPTTVSPPTTTSPGVTPPAATAGQSWCVAKSGSPAASVQAALDYACANGADCAAIQQGGVCYSPNGLQNHASYAFNSYYLKHSRQATNCDFNGAAQLVNANPSSGSCVYPTAASSTSPSTTTPMTPSSSGSFAAPPTSTSTTSSTSSISMLSGLQEHFISCIILLASIITVFNF